MMTEAKTSRRKFLKTGGAAIAGGAALAAPNISIAAKPVVVDRLMPRSSRPNRRVKERCSSLLKPWLGIINTACSSQAEYRSSKSLSESSVAAKSVTVAPRVEAAGSTCTGRQFVLQQHQ